MKINKNKIRETSSPEKGPPKPKFDLGDAALYGDSLVEVKGRSYHSRELDGDNRMNWHYTIPDPKRGLGNFLEVYESSLEAL